MRSAVAALIAIGGCGRVAFDAQVAIDASLCGDATYFDPCLVPSSSDDVAIATGSTYNTDTGELDGIAYSSVVDTTRDPSVRIQAFRRLTIDSAATLRVIGSMPLALVVEESITIAGALDIAGRISEPGAGGHACAGGATSGMASLGGGGGGGGGGFGAAGGDGAPGDGDNGPTLPGAGGTPITIGPLRGGCAGAAGGTGNDAAGAGGHAGGGILLASSMITISGFIRAGGLGGRGGEVGAGGDGGGGGGGSGGMIVLAAETLMLGGAVLAANGGAGGEGSTETSPGAPGGNGSDANTPALGGGFGDTDARNDGGEGGYRDRPHGLAPPGPTSNGGGGGGGGSAGAIRIRAGTTIGTATAISPAAESF